MNYDEWAMRGTIVLICGELIRNPRTDLGTIRKADALGKYFQTLGLGFVPQDTVLILGPRLEPPACMCS